MWITGYIEKSAPREGRGYLPMSSGRINEYRKEVTGGGKVRKRKNERKLETREGKNIIFTGGQWRGNMVFELRYGSPLLELASQTTLNIRKRNTVDKILQILTCNRAWAAGGWNHGECRNICSTPK
jgi:hypothetical protein